jgi:hypothetical protein
VLSLPPPFLVADGLSQRLTLAGGAGFGGLIAGNIESELAQTSASPAPTLPSFPF